ncbi:MAG: hypothetical protein JSR83_01985 [Proteobacteria bacterium]|nr:hypothetical protein [Pseudomonadota bacterium]
MVEEPESETARFERILDLIRQAIIHRQANRLEASLACLNKVLNENPELHALNLTRAETLLAQGEYEAAWHGVESYEQATGRAGDTQALRTLIREAAAADFSVRLTREPDDVPALRDKAAFLLATKDFQAAEATCARLLARSPDDEQSLSGTPMSLQNWGGRVKR